MPDSNITIGATFDKGQLDAAMAEGAAAVQKIPEAFNLAFQEASTSSQRALRQISDDTKAAASTVSAEMKQAASATLDYRSALAEVRAASKLATDGSMDETQSLSLLAAAKQRVATASKTLTEAEKAAGLGAKGETEANEGLIASLGHLRERLTLTSEGIRGNLFESGGVSGALGAALGVGLLGEYIDKLKESEMQLNLLSDASGVSVASLARLQAAFQLQGVPVENFSQVLTRLAEHMVEAQEGDKSMAEYFGAVGVSTEALTNQHLKLDDVLQLMASHLSANVGNAQDLGATYALLGRGAGEFVSGLQGLNKTLAEQRDHVDALAASAVKASDAARQLDATEQSFGQTIKTSLLPVLPVAAESAKLLGEAFLGVKYAIESLEIPILSFGLAIVHGLEGAIAAARDYAHDRVMAAEGDLKAASLQMSDDWKAMSATMKQTTADTWADMKKIWSPDGAPAPKPTGVPPPLTPTKDPNKVAMAALQEELAAEKLNHEMGLADELNFWQMSEGIVKSGSAQRLEILKTEAALAQQIERQAHSANLAELKAGYEAKVEADKLWMAEGDAATKAMMSDIQKRMQAESQATALQMEGNEKAALAAIELEKQKTDGLLQLGKINAQQKIQLDQESENRSFRIEQDFLKRKLALLNSSDPDYPVQRQKIMSQVEALEAKHNAKMLSLAQQSAMAHKKLWDDVTQTMNRAFDQSMRGIMQGTQSLGDAFRNMSQSIIASFADSMEQMLAKYLETHLLMRAAGKIEAILGIGQDAAKSAAGAYSATVGIPIVGPAIAPAAAAQAYGTVLGMEALVSAAGGQWQIPNAEQLTMLHKNEMVLPAKFAEPLRRTVQSGGSGGDIHLHVHATDAQSVTRLFQNNGATLAAVIRTQIRKGAFA